MENAQENRSRWAPEKQDEAHMALPPYPSTPFLFELHEQRPVGARRGRPRLQGPVQLLVLQGGLRTIDDRPGGLPVFRPLSSGLSSNMFIIRGTSTARCPSRFFFFLITSSGVCQLERAGAFDLQFLTGFPDGPKQPVFQITILDLGSNKPACGWTTGSSMKP